MNREMLHRLKTAGEYQKKAIMALLPEPMERHLDVIEKEIKMMVVETVAEMVWECRKRDAAWEKQEQEGTDAAQETQVHEKTAGTKKVDIE